MAVERLRLQLIDGDDDRSELREALALALLKDFGPVDRHLLRALTEIETLRAQSEGGCGDALYALCFMLYWLGNEDDEALIWEAKYSNMDTGSMIDPHMLTMRKIGKLESIDREKYPRLYKTVQEGMQRPDYESDEALREDVLGYFGLD